MSQNLKALKVLVVARDALVRFGWQKGAMGTTKTGFCASGALCYATKDYKARQAAEAILQNNYPAKALATMVNNNPYYSQYGAKVGVITFNDQYGRQKRTILSWFDRAIKAAAGK